MENETKPRLFLKSDEITDGTGWYCGGPEVADAARGLANYFKIYSESCENPPSLLEFVKGIQMTVTPMTDAEVAALPDV